MLSFSQSDRDITISSSTPIIQFPDFSAFSYVPTDAHNNKKSRISAGSCLLFNDTGLCDVLVPVGTLFRITLLCFEIDEEEAVAFLVTVGPREHIH